MAKLYQWYLSPHRSGGHILHGIVTGHPNISDSTRIHTSPILDAHLHPDEPDTYVFRTHRTEYICRLEDCSRNQCDSFLNDILAYTDIPGWLLSLRQHLLNAPQPEYRSFPDIPDNTILLRLGNNFPHYFGGMFVHVGGRKLTSEEVCVHLGMFIESFLCLLYDNEQHANYDLSYFLHSGGHIQFYGWLNNSLPVRIENCGDDSIEIALPPTIMNIRPGEQVQIAPIIGRLPCAPIDWQEISSLDREKDFKDWR